MIVLPTMHKRIRRSFLRLVLLFGALGVLMVTGITSRVNSSTTSKRPSQAGARCCKCSASQASATRLTTAVTA